MLKSKLINYKSNIEMNIENRNEEIKILKYKQLLINNSNETNVNTTASANNNTNITIEHVLDNISKLPTDLIIR